MDYKNKILTYIRKKPLLESDSYDICNVDSINKLQIKIDFKKYNLENITKYKNFYADHIFDDKTTNEEIFTTLIKPILNTKKKIVFFTYGQSGSGKTYTLLNNNGLIINSIKQLLPNTITFSSFQIYEGDLIDLQTNQKINIYEINNSINISGLKEEKFNSLSEFERILNINKQNRKNGVSSHNNNSSRSHAIYKIKYTLNNNEFVLQFIDLAGTERSRNLNIHNVIKNSYINNSLFSLKMCILAYINNNKYIPFRNNKLTLYLKEYFIMDCHLIMLSLISASNKNVVDTLDTLKYTNYMGEIHKNIKIEKIKEPKLILPILNKYKDQNKDKREFKDYIDKRDELIKEEDLLFNNKDIFKDKKLYNNFISILNKKVNLIEGLCNYLK
jgi:hypothetical protein